MQRLCNWSRAYAHLGVLRVFPQMHLIRLRKSKISIHSCATSCVTSPSTEPPRDIPLQKQQESRRSRSYIMCGYNCVMGDQRVGAAALLIFFINFVSPPHVGRGDVGVRGGVPCRRHGDGQYVSAGYCGRRFLRASSNKGTGWKTVPSYQSQPPTFASPMKFAGLPTDSDKFATGTFYRRNLTDRAVFADTVE